MNLNSLMTLGVPRYSPVSDNEIYSFDTDSVRQWLMSVIDNLLNVEVTITDTVLHRNTMSNVLFFDSPYFKGYIDYVRTVVLPGYLDYLIIKNPPRDDVIERVLMYLLSAAEENMIIPLNRTYQIINFLFPHIKGVDQPSSGNCYYCAIGHNLDENGKKVRDDIATYIEKTGQVDKYAKMYIQGCGKGSLVDRYNRDMSKFIQEFPSLLRKSCIQGDRDCYNCIWGSDDYDPLVANIYSRPLVTTRVDRKHKVRTLDLDIYSYEERNIIRYYLHLHRYGNPSYLENQDFFINISYIFPEFMYQLYPDLEDIFFLEIEKPIGYMYREQHFVALDFI
jgi:hypothetical protein